MKVITHIEIADDWSEEQLRQAGTTPESVKVLYEKSFHILMDQAMKPGARYTLTVTVEDNTKEATK